MTANSASTWDRLCEYVAAQVKETGVPGVAVGILSEGYQAVAGFGVTNVEHPLPVTGETLFQVGSITKTFVATAIMRLVEMGKLELDVPARVYLPEFRVADETTSAQATLRHLLTHTGGWEGDLFLDTGAGDGALASYVAEMATLEQLAPVGDLFDYNNSGFSLAGRVVEVVAGNPFETALRELVLEPLGLQHTYLNPGDVMTHRFAAGHNQSPTGATVARPWPLARAACPAGGIVCSVSELLRYARFQMGDGTAEGGTRLLSEESLAQMHAPQVIVWKDEGWGLGWSIDDSAGVRQAGHGGGTLGQISLLTLIPDRRFGVVTLTNGNRGRLITDRIRRWALKEYLGIDVPEVKPMEAFGELLPSYTGRYTRPSAEWEIGMLCGRLVAQVVEKYGFPSRDMPPSPPPPPMTLTLCQPDRLLVLDGEMKDSRLDIIRRPDGSIGWLRAGLRIHPRRSSAAPK